ncbi:MAG: pantoate kinase [Candidatus Methanomethylicia archaeon]|jgi:pantoate kinase|uniref:Pantoate kinase n=1 Tax=Thermoproteota archaeon TaxID=2056631 RepID=A0A520KGT2_9CREN|nr:pantoate kinase [Candidatus Methanomethylicia archaeon]MCQ5340504.1 pantoate kinase [Candidatus Methanomethylicia archaeon]RZN57476.1 MAG: hypothetical protein EF809_00785 [Candidatus Verstraetearchaeota archaeon]TDA38641.1 MAG: hypothetical protein DSO09_03970 [Candidatus Verstraetearchaeota archaeon]
MIGESYVPAHITGFFRIHLSKDYLTTGSTGAGICLEAGVITHVDIKKSNKMKIKFLWNNEEKNNSIIHPILGFLVDNPIEIIIKQKSLLPIGYGYGMSGASTLGLVLAINKALGMPIKKEEAYNIAHILEVRRKTGFGDVIAQIVGGFEFRKKPGAPTFGEVIRLPDPNGWLVVTTPVKIMNTNKMINHKINKINEYGLICEKEFLNEPTIENFMKISRKFWENLGLIDNEIINIIKIYENLGLPYISIKKGIVYGIIDEDHCKKIFELKDLENPVLINKNGLIFIISKLSKIGAY